MPTQDKAMTIESFPARLDRSSNLSQLIALVPGLRKASGQRVLPCADSDQGRTIGPIARPETIQWAQDLPKTRSGKIMRRILRRIAQGQTAEPGDT